MLAPIRKPEPVPVAASLAELTDSQRLQAEERRSLVAAWRALCLDFAAAGRTKGEATRVFLERHPGISKSSLYEWARRRDEGDIMLDGRSIAPRMPAGPVSDAAWEHFKELWLTPQRRSIRLCYQIVEAQARREGWSWPRLRTIQAKVKRELPPIHADYFRLDEREWHRRWGLKARRDYSQYRAGQLWVGDFHLCDVFCRRSDADAAIVRPLLCGWMDLRSRVITARIVERENQDAILLTLRDGVQRWGPPNEVCIDNGKPYRATGISGGRPGARRIEDEAYVRSVLGALDVRVHFSIPYNPDSKPIERWFRTFEEQFGATFASYCGGDNSDPRFKAAFNLAKKHPERCPTVEEYSQALVRYVESYHATPHTGDGMEGLCPADAFLRFDPIPRAVAPEGVLDLLLMRPTKPVKVTGYGVRYNGIEYGQADPRLFALQGSEVLLRVDPRDAGYVVVCDLEGKPICRANNNRLARTGVTQDDVAEGMKRRNRARRLVKQVHEGGARAALQSVTDAAIAARLEAGQRASKERLAATGTDDVAPRNIRPLRSDLTESVLAYHRQFIPATPPDEPAVTFEELADMIEPEPPPAEPELNIEDLAPFL